MVGTGHAPLYLPMQDVEFHDISLHWQVSLRALEFDDTYADSSEVHFRLTCFLPVNETLYLYPP
jgi:hypothetical protein